MLWVILLLVVALFAVLQHQAKVESHEDPPAGGADQGPGFMLRFASRYALGAKTVAGLFKAPDRDQMRDLEHMVQDMAHTPADTIRIVPLIAELSGPREALRRLEELAAFDAIEGPLADDAAALRTIYARGPEHLDPADRARLRQRHGWFGDVALTYGLGPSDQQRARVLRPAFRTLAVTVAVALGVIGAALVGLGLLTVAVVLIAAGKLRGAHDPHQGAGGPGRGPPMVLLEVFILFLLATLGVQLIARGVESFTGLDLQWLLLWMLLAVVLWARLRGMSWAQLRRALGWYRGRGIVREAWSGVLGLLAGLPIVGIGIAITALLVRSSEGDVSHPIIEQTSSRGWMGVLSIYLLACVWAPLVEETMFRGALYSHVRQRRGICVSGLVVALVFAALHPQGWAAIPALMGLALVFALIREWRGSLIGPVVAHAVNNAVVVSFVVLVS